MSVLQRIALVLIIIGAVNWGLIGLFQYDLVAGVFGGGDQLAAFPRIIYTLVGISGLVSLSILFTAEPAFVDHKDKEYRTDL